MTEIATADCVEYVLFDFKGNTKRETVFRCNSSVLFHSEKYIIIRKTLVSTYTDTVTNIPLDTTMSIFLTCKIENNRHQLIRGFLYIQDKEYPIQEYDLFSSLQIGRWGYDNIAICTLSSDPFPYGV